METIYAIYKENVLPLVGGVAPAGVETGLGEYNGWKLCKVPLDKADNYSEFNFYYIPEDIAIGMMLSGKKEYETIQDDLDDMPDEIKAEHQHTEDEKELMNLAQNFLDKLELKFITRAKIRQFKDFEDDFADTKLLIEFLIAYMIEDFKMKSDEEKQNHQMKDFLEAFINGTEGILTKIDEERFLKKLPKIIKDEEFISRIVEMNYIKPLKELKKGEDR